MLVKTAAVALCAVGAEKTVSNELRKLGLKVTEGGFGQVKFEAGLRGLYTALTGLRAADRVLLECPPFEAPDFDALFEGVRKAPWEEYIPRGMGLAVAKVRTNRSALQAETSIQAVAHKAAAERLCAKWGIRRLPEDTPQADLRIHIEKNKVSAQLDLSGAPLFKRGYRTEGGAAPLRETTAAAIILHSLWRRKYPLYDPFCGSGTIAVEAAMFAWDIAPGLGRHFALERLAFADRAVEKSVREEFLERASFDRLVRIGGSDSDAGAAAAARANMERAIALVKGQAPAEMPSFRVLPVEEAEAPWAAVPGGPEHAGPAGFIITNPPYGRRLGSPADAEKTYTSMGNLARRFPGWKLAVISDHPGFESFFGRKADSCREITNGALRSYLYQYGEL